MTRLKSMTAINAALEQPIQPALSDVVTSPHALPGQETETPLTDNLPIDQTGTETSDETPDQLTRQQQLKKSAASINAAQRAYDAAANVTSGAGAKLEALPQPGSIALPLTILLTFFFLLLPVNGHTRAVWLWLALTGNADVNNGGGGGGGDQTPQIVVDGSIATLSQPVDLQAYVSALSSQMTGVEDMS